MAALPTFLEAPPRFMFFTGKGGVGKTSIACATAVHLAKTGARVLLVSTDPASNVGQVLQVPIGHRLTAVPAVPGLVALEIDPEAAADAYRERIVAPVRDLLPAAEVASITEQLSGSCTTEVASFNEFTLLLTDSEEYAEFQHIVFDTAPTGHTIRLLQLPGSWTDYLDVGKGDTSCLGPLAGLEKQRAVYAEALAALRDPRRTRMVLVTRPQTSAITEVARTFDELAAIGFRNQHLVVNGVLPAAATAEPLGRHIAEGERDALAELPAPLAQLPRSDITLHATAMVGLAALSQLFEPVELPTAVGADSVLSRTDDGTAAVGGSTDADLDALIDDMAAGEHGLILCMGKGGVGKTTIAAAIAVGLVARGHDVHLTTTDPAAHLGEALPSEVTGLQVSRIDPVAATEAYRDHVMATKGKNLDEAGRAILREDLQSPCTEEVAVFGQFSQAVAESRRRFVVIDTAPTGHTLLLLDAAGSYHREIARQLGDSGSFTTPLMRLQDPNQTKVVLVTLAEPTPVTEALALASDLRRAAINPWAWVVNNSLAVAGPEGAFLRQRAAAEIPQIERVQAAAPQVAVVPSLPFAPVGQAALLRLAAAQPQVALGNPSHT